MKHAITFASGLILVVAAFALAAEPAAQIKVGDTVVVARDGAKLMVGTKAVADLAKGTPIKVTGINGDWIGGTTAGPGAATNGWVKKTDVTHAAAVPAVAAAAPVLKTLRGEWERPAETADGIRISVSIEITPKDELFARVMRVGGGKISGEMFLFATSVSTTDGKATLTLTEEGATTPAGTVTYAVKDGKLSLQGNAKNVRGREVEFTGEYTRTKK
jgi:hypothetical protein